jgi:hypothetical protein
MKLLLATLLLLSFSIFAQDFKVYEDSLGNYGFKNSNDKIIIPAVYSFAYPFKEGLSLVNKGGTTNPWNGDFGGGVWGYINTKGKEVIPVQYHYAGSFSEGRAIVYMDGKVGFIDKKGKLVIPFEYDPIACGSRGV